MQVTEYTLYKLQVPVEPPLVDARAGTDTVGVLYLELGTDTGQVGIGVDDDLSGLSQTALRDQFEGIGDRLTGTSPFALLGRTGRPHGLATTDWGPDRFRKAVDFALWDLCGKALDSPVYELLGGTDPAVRAYASGVGYGLDRRTVERIYEPYADLGVTAVKAKVGYESLEADLEKLRTVRAVMGEDATLMADANGQWSPKETSRRVRAYREAGFDLEWIEDPTQPSAVEEIRRTVAACPSTAVSTGEYVDFDGKRELLARGACDVLNLRTGLFSNARHAAALADSHGVPVQVGQSLGDIGVHLGAALPNCGFVEYRLRPWADLTDGGPSLEDGRLVAPDTPGHGVSLARATIEEHTVD